MGYDNANMVWTARQVFTMVQSGKIIFDNIIQRSYVWEKARKSLFIHSIMIGIPIPPTYAKRSEIANMSKKKGNSMYDMLDGKQRLSTICDFLNGKFILGDLPPVTFYNDINDRIETEDVSGKVMSELSEGLQEIIKGSKINVIYFDSLTRDEERELFKRLNNGKQLTTKSRILASCQNLEELIDIGDHDLFNEMLTNKARDNKNQVTIIMKTWCMMFRDIADVSFESKHFNKLLESTEISDEQQSQMIQVFDKILVTHSLLVKRKEKKIARKLYTETHFISLIPFFVKVINDGIDEEYVADWLIGFFKTGNSKASVSEKYNNATGAGSAKNVSIQTRNSELENSFSEFFKVDEPGSDEPGLESEVIAGNEADAAIDNEEDTQKTEEESTAETSEMDRDFVDEILADTEDSSDSNEVG